MWEIFEQQIPWKGIGEYKVLVRIMKRETLPIPKHEVGDIIARCLEFEPQKRPTAAEVETKLKEMCQNYTPLE